MCPPSLAPKVHGAGDKFLYSQCISGKVMFESSHRTGGGDEGGDRHVVTFPPGNGGHCCELGGPAGM